MTIAERIAGLPKMPEPPIYYDDDRHWEYRLFSDVIVYGSFDAMENRWQKDRCSVIYARLALLVKASRAYLDAWDGGTLLAITAAKYDLRAVTEALEKERST